VRPLKTLSEKVFKLRAVKFGQNMHKMQTDNFSDKDIGVLGFFCHRKFKPSSKGFFFLAEKHAKQTVLVSGEQKFVRTSQRASYTRKKNLMELPLI
jgi:hypothetical protein